LHNPDYATRWPERLRRGGGATETDVRTNFLKESGVLVEGFEGLARELDGDVELGLETWLKASASTWAASLPRRRSSSMPSRSSAGRTILERRSSRRVFRFSPVAPRSRADLLERAADHDGGSDVQAVGAAVESLLERLADEVGDIGGIELDAGRSFRLTFAKFVRRFGSGSITRSDDDRVDLGSTLGSES
jgi:hypothetical protein